MSKLYFWGTESHFKLVAEAAKTLNISVESQSLSDTAAIQKNLASDIPVILIYSSPASHLAERFQEQAVQEALQSWQAEANALITLHKANRRKLTLINVDTAASVSLEAGHPLQALLPKLAAAQQTGLAKVVANATIQQQPDLSQLVTLLQAISLPAEPESAQPVQWVAELSTLTKQSAKVSELEQHEALLKQQLNLVQQELEVVFAEKQQKQLALAQVEQAQADVKTALEQSEQQQAQLKQQLTTSQTEQQQTQQQLQETKEENELLLLQLMQVQEELEKYYLQHQAQLKDNQQLQAQHSKQAAEWQQSQQQLQQQVKQLQQDAQQRQQQWQQQQQSYVNAQRDATAKQNHSNMLLKQAERELSKAQAEIDKLQRQLAGASLNGQQAQAELKAVKSSTLWKAMAPVRKLKSDSKKKQLQLQKEISLVRTCPLFDTDWYLQHNPDVASAQTDPIEHYLKYGAKEGRVPGPDFDGNWYISHYPDVASSGINPLVHYIKFGQLEGRQTSPKLLQLKTTK